MNQDYKDALTGQLEAEIDVFGEVAEFRGDPLSLIKSTSEHTKEMIQAGYYDETTFDAFIASLTPKPKTNELMTYENETYFIKHVEEGEFGTSFRLVLQKAK